MKNIHGNFGLVIYFHVPNLEGGSMEIKILIAEDESLFRDLVCDIVRKEGYITVEASNGKEAIDVFFGSNDIDLIINSKLETL